MYPPAPAESTFPTPVPASLKPSLLLTQLLALGSLGGGGLSLVPLRATVGAGVVLGGW